MSSKQGSFTNRHCHVAVVAHKFYSTGVTHRLVWMLIKLQKILPGLSKLKPSSNFDLQIAWIKKPTMRKQKHEIKSYDH